VRVLELHDVEQRMSHCKLDLDREFCLENERVVYYVTVNAPIGRSNAHIPYPRIGT
jgi:hypothetical protein